MLTWLESIQTCSRKQAGTRYCCQWFQSLDGWKSNCCLGAVLYCTALHGPLAEFGTLPPPLRFTCCFCYTFCAYLSLFLYCGPRLCRRPRWQAAPSPLLRISSTGNGSRDRKFCCWIFCQVTNIFAWFAHYVSPSLALPVSHPIIAPYDHPQCGSEATLPLPCFLN